MVDAMGDATALAPPFVRVLASRASVSSPKWGVESKLALCMFYLGFRVRV